MPTKSPISLEKTSPVPTRSLWSLHDAMDHLFENWFNEFELEPLWGAREKDGFDIPRIDMVDNKNELLVSAELPGVDEKNIEVTLEENRLIIQGKKEEETEEKGREFYRKERRFGSIYRAIPLPCDVQEDKVKAEFTKGVLKVTLPKSQQTEKKRKRVEIRGH